MSLLGKPKNIMTDERDGLNKVWYMYMIYHYVLIKTVGKKVFIK